MSLTYEDLQAIRTIVQEELQPLRGGLKALEGRLEALENDVKEIYYMLADLQKTDKKVKVLKEKSVQDQILETYKNLQVIAKRAGVTLPK